ncbi:cold-shock' DNA-binding domain-containing protein [Blakeslea trispora]|nr:cold-shock' DNA-binding domain-containing protein [Blakeslea trispora]
MSTIESDSRHKGRVKFFNSTKGFGFILPDLNENSAEEVFVHHTAIYNDGGFKSLAEGEEVEYDLIQGPKGMQASHVTGPNGASVKGDTRAHTRQPYSTHYNKSNYRGNPRSFYGHNESNGNAGNGRAGNYMMDPYTFGYGIMPPYPYMNLAQAQYGQPSSVLHYGYGNTSNSSMVGFNVPSYQPMMFTPSNQEAYSQQTQRSNDEQEDQSLSS